MIRNDSGCLCTCVCFDFNFLSELYGMALHWAVCWNNARFWHHSSYLLPSPSITESLTSPPPPPPMWSLFFLQVSETNVTTVDSTHISPRRSQSNPPPFLVKWNPGFDRHICVRLQSSVEKWSQKVSLLSFLIVLLVVNKISGESRLWAKERARFYFSRPAVLRSLISSFSAK